LWWPWGGYWVPTACLPNGFVVALMWLWVALGGFAATVAIRCWRFDVRCWMFGSRSASGLRHPLEMRGYSVISRLVALSLTFQWLASTVCAPAMRKAQPSLARTNALAVTKRSNPLRAQQLCLREDRLYSLLLQVGRVAVFVQDALHHDFDLGTGAFAERPVVGHALPHFGD